MVISVTNQPTKSMVQYVVMGGTFDPVHYGHIKSALQLCQAMSYPKVYMMPCGDAYHKGHVTEATHRAAMLSLAIEDEACLKLDLRETQRQGATYTVDTLMQLRQELGQVAHIAWVMGTDAAKNLTKWRNWQQIFKLANVIVIHRAEQGIDDMDTKDWPAKAFEQIDQFKQQAHGGFITLALEPFEESSTQIREALRDNQSVDNHVPQAVLNYIEQHGLYRGNH